MDTRKRIQEVSNDRVGEEKEVGMVRTHFFLHGGMSIMVKEKHFINYEAYKKNEAFQHIHGVNPEGGPYAHIIIHGHKHKVKHKK